MNYEEFKKLVAEVQENDADFWRTHEELKLGEEPATDEDIQRVERELNAKLPEDYIAFLKDYGGGLFGEDIYSAKSDGQFYIVKHQLPQELIQNFVAVSPNDCGDEYGFRVVDGKCQPEILFCDHEIGFELCPTDFANILDYIASSLKSE